MEVWDAVAARRSVRAFEARQVPRDLLEDVMGQALRAPSWGNTQPWGFTVVSGKPLVSVREELAALIMQKSVANPELPFPEKWSEAQALRYKGVGKAMLGSAGIARNDADLRNEFYQSMGGFFKAPHMIFVHIDRDSNAYALLDCGLIMQTIALLAIEKGLGTCMMAIAVSYPEMVRKHVSIPADTSLVAGIAIGYPVPDSPLNLFQSERGRPEEFIRWVDE